MHWHRKIGCGGAVIWNGNAPNDDKCGRPHTRLGSVFKRKAKGIIMRYEVRCLIGGDEQTIEVDADDAATAAAMAQEQYLESAENFELIQVHLLDEMPDQLEPASPSAS